MADLNVFKTLTKSIQDSTGDLDMYQAPDGYTGIVLSFQITNASDSDEECTITFHDSATAEGVHLLSQLDCPPRESFNATAGKLVVTTGGVLRVSGRRSGNLKGVIGILESLNG